MSPAATDGDTDGPTMMMRGLTSTSSRAVVMAPDAREVTDAICDQYFAHWEYPSWIELELECPAGTKYQIEVSVRSVPLFEIEAIQSVDAKSSKSEVPQ